MPLVMLVLLLHTMGWKEERVGRSIFVAPEGVIRPKKWHPLNYIPVLVSTHLHPEWAQYTYLQLLPSLARMKRQLEKVAANKADSAEVQNRGWPRPGWTVDCAFFVSHYRTKTIMHCTGSTACNKEIDVHSPGL